MGDYDKFDVAIEANCKKIEQLEKLTDVKFGSVEKDIINNKELMQVELKAIRDKMKDTARVTDTRLENLNRLRDEVTTDREQLLRKETYDGKITTYDNWIITVEKRFSTAETRAATWTAAIGLFFLMVQIGMRFIK